MDYNADDTKFTGYRCKLKTPDFIKLPRSEYGNGTYFKQDRIEAFGDNCCIPTSGYSFIK